MFRFTIRDVLWLTMVVALAVGWWRDHSALQAVQSWWVDHVTLEHSSNPNDFKRLMEREGPPISHAGRIDWAEAHDLFLPIIFLWLSALFSIAVFYAAANPNRRVWQTRLAELAVLALIVVFLWLLFFPPEPSIRS